MPSSVTMRTTGVSPMTAHFRSVIFIFPQRGPRWKSYSPEGTHRESASRVTADISRRGTLRQVTSRVTAEISPEGTHGGERSRGTPSGGGDGLADGHLMAGARGLFGGEEDFDDVAAPGGG